jgi:hypothetical protein
MSMINVISSGDGAMPQASAKAAELPNNVTHHAIQQPRSGVSRVVPSEYCDLCQNLGDGKILTNAKLKEAHPGLPIHPNLQIDC